MALSELYYSTRDFTALRAEVFNEEKEDMLRHPKRKAVIILNSPNAVIEITTASRKPLTIITARKASPVTIIANKKKIKETIQISHDTNLPIYIFGNVEELVCTGQRLTECYLVNCPNLSRLDVSNNQLAKMRLCQSMPDLRWQAKQIGWIIKNV